MRGAVFLLLLLWVVPAQAAAPEGFSTIVGSAAAGGMDMHGSQVVWGAEKAGGTDLIILDLDTGQEQTVTTVPPGARLTSLHYDGRWIAWIDTRFGAPDLFAADAHTGASKRITNGGQGTLDAALADGRLAWARDGRLHVVDLANETSIEVAGGSLSQPAITSDRLFWIQADSAAATRLLYHGELDGSNASTVDDAPGQFAYAPRAAGDHVAWVARALRDADRPEAGFLGYVVKLAYGNGTVRNASTPLPSSPGLDVSKHAVAWSTGTAVSWCSLDAWECQAVLTSAGRVAASDSHLGILEAQGHYGSIHARPWEFPESVDSPMPLLGLLALGLAAAWRRLNGA